MGVHYTATKVEQSVMIALPSSFFIGWVYWLYQLDYGIYTLCLLFILGLWVSSSIAMGIHVYMCYKKSPQRQAE